MLGVYDVRRNKSADLQEAIDIGVRRSTDGGRTWEPMRIAKTFAGERGLPPAQCGIGDPSILVDHVAGSEWIVAAHTFGMGNGRAWTHSMPGMSEEYTAQLMMVRSNDDGATRSAPMNIPPQVGDASWHFLLQGPGRGITIRDVTPVYAIQFIDSVRMPHAGIMYSRDHGRSYSASNLSPEIRTVRISPFVVSKSRVCAPYRRLHLPPACDRMVARTSTPSAQSISTSKLPRAHSPATLPDDQCDGRAGSK